MGAGVRRATFRLLPSLLTSIIYAHPGRRHGRYEHQGAQAGLNWSTVLNKRDAYRRAFNDFDPEKVARYTEKRIEKLMLDAGIIRNRMKIESAVRNAKAFLAAQEEFGRV
jgi:DNA-3-methyladenine glycosylase I